ncbi:MULTISPECIES: hypothetical protein [Falsihalocynthiibacter]|uniref:hypothetical protein n=1 Tax=Falsihalocynthiibacter TaxID=2854182 RepID=UPI003002562F
MKLNAPNSMDREISMRGDGLKPFEEDARISTVSFNTPLALARTDTIAHRLKNCMPISSIFHELDLLTICQSVTDICLRKISSGQRLATNSPKQSYKNEQKPQVQRNVHSVAFSECDA